MSSITSPSQKNISPVICKYNWSGYCKYKSKCKKKHLEHTCRILGCEDISCHLKKRHPALCRYNKRGTCRWHTECAYLHTVHEATTSDLVLKLMEKMALMEKIIEDLSLQLAGNKPKISKEEYKFECQTCGKRYKKKAYLVRHQANHVNKEVSTKKKKDTVPDETVEKEATKEGTITSNTPSTQTLDSDTPVKCGDPDSLVDSSPSTNTTTNTKETKDTVPDETVEKEVFSNNITILETQANPPSHPDAQTLGSDTPVKCGDPGLLPSTMTHTTTSAAVTTTATMGSDSSSSSSCSSGSPLPPITFNAGTKPLWLIDTPSPRRYKGRKST